MFETLDHVGIAVRSLEDALEVWRDAFGLRLDRIEEVASQEVRVAFLEVGGEPVVELLEPTSDTSPIARHIERRGEGVHHLSFGVDDVDAATAALPDEVELALSPTDREGGYRIAFVHPGSTCGVLVELEDGSHANDDAS